MCAREHAPRVAQLGREVFGTLALIVDRTRPFAWDSWADEVGLETPEPNQVIELDTMSAVVRAAERGLGDRARADGVVRFVDAQRARWCACSRCSSDTADSYYLVSRPKDAEKPPVKALTRWALQEYQRG